MEKTEKKISIKLNERNMHGKNTFMCITTCNLVMAVENDKSLCRHFIIIGFILKLTLAVSKSFFLILDWFHKILLLYRVSKSPAHI